MCVFVSAVCIPKMRGIQRGLCREFVMEASDYFYIFYMNKSLLSKIFSMISSKTKNLAWFIPFRDETGPTITSNPITIFR